MFAAHLRSLQGAVGRMWARRPPRRILLRRMAMACGAACAVFALSVLVIPAPAFEDARAAVRGSEAVLLDRHGTPLQRLRIDQQSRVLDWIALGDVSPAMRDAVLAAEDQRFYWHPGVDPLALASAMTDNLRRTRPRGASTLSMQVASLLDDAPEDGPRGVFDKLRQMRGALAIELRWSKAEIFEYYLNRVGFRGELRGIDAAARGLLGKGPGGLDHTESAVLAALIRAPSASRVRVAQRACAVLRAQDLAGHCERASFAASGLPKRPLPMRGIDEAPHLARRLLSTPGQQLRSTLDADLQRFANEALRSQLSQLVDRNVQDGALVVIDNRSGEVLAWVGSSGSLSASSAVDGVTALRQPGSTLKPFLFGVAIDRGWLTAASILDDSPLALTTPSGLYVPQDYDRTFRGAVSVRTALAASLNVPSVRALTLVGVERFLQTLRDAGLDSLDREANYYGFGLALGGAETTLLALTNAYRALANEGQWTPTKLALSQSSDPPAVSRQVLGREASFILADILADPAARATTFGLGSPLSARTWAAVKTGTSKGMRDNWAIGFTSRYTVGVWVGNFSGEPMWDVSGITGAAPVWRDVVEYLHSREASHAPTPPASLQLRRIAYRPAVEPAREEWLPKDAAAVVQVDIAVASPHIVAPPDSAVLAPDPDIPQARQSLLVQASAGGEAGDAGRSTCLWLDGVALARCGQSRVLVPLPAPGQHRVELRDAQGRVLDQHAFSVRGLFRVPRPRSSDP